MVQPDQVILYVEDDESDAYLFERGFKQAGINHRLVIVPSGKAAIQYLDGTGQYADRVRYPMPCLMLLDLKMPGISGLEVLKWIRATPKVSTLVVVILTSSNQGIDIRRAYAQGANSYLLKPGNLDGIVTMARAINDYWLIQNRSSTSVDTTALDAADSKNVIG